MEDDFKIYSPSKSELATFQVFANMDFVNLNKEVEQKDVAIHLVEDEAEYEEEESFHMPEKELELHNDLKDFAPDSPESKMSSKASSVSETFSKASSKLSKVSEKPEPKVPQEKFRPRKSKYREEVDAEIEAEKEGLLAELANLERQGLTKLVRPLSMADSLEEIQFQYDRTQAEINSNQMVEFAKSAIKMGSGMVEMVLKKTGIKLVDGYHNNLCKDMNKFNRPLNRLYKKYWRRGGVSPEAELGMLVFGSLAWTVIQNKMGSASAFVGGGQDSAFTAEKESPQPPMSNFASKPPQMSSLHVPSSWATEKEDDKKEELLETTNKLKKTEQEKMTLQAKDNENEQIIKNLMQQLEKTKKELELSKETESIDASDDESVTEELPPKKIIPMNKTMTPKKSARAKKTLAIDI